MAIELVDAEQIDAAQEAFNARAPIVILNKKYLIQSILVDNNYTRYGYGGTRATIEVVPLTPVLDVLGRGKIDNTETRRQLGPTGQEKDHDR